MGGSDIDEVALRSWLAEVVGDSSGELKVKRFPAGQSNPTYRVDYGEASYALRRKPFGKLLPSAHAVDREYRILEALTPSGFPVPRPIALCQDTEIIGVEFYLMACVEGRVFRDNHLPDQTPQQRRALILELIGNLADLHKIDYRAAGLTDFERPGNYFERQVQRWTKQYRATQTDDLPEMEKLIEYLPKTLPEQKGQALIHGDYRLENVMYEADAPRINAVLDWELATIGDPLADLAYMLQYWVLPSEEASSVAGVDFEATGIPSLEQALEHYRRKSGRESLPDMSWYFSYNLFRLAGILQGVKKRMIDGNASSAKAQEAVDLMPFAIRASWQQAKKSGA
jgi:aminoglycoside phosphotransferase (APT) family kinase protein